MTGSQRDDPVVAAFERRMAGIEALIPEAPAWRTPEEAAGRRLTVVAGSSLRAGERVAGVPRRRWATPPLGAAAVLVVAVAAVAVILTPQAVGPGQPPPVPTASPLGSPSSSPGATIPASLRGDALLVQDTVDGNTDLYLMPLDGSSKVRLTADPAPDREGAWTPDGSAIVYAHGDDGESRLQIMRADGSGPRPLVAESSEVAGFDAYSPDVSPDGRSLAFIRGVEADRAELWVSAMDGSDARRLVGPDHPFIADPAWTPDGRSIHLMVDESAGGEIAIHQVDVATGALTMLDLPARRLDTSVLCYGEESGFALSPDGTRIVYQSDCGGGLWLANADFTDAQRWYGVTDKGYPLDWSPDGRWIAYAPPGALQLLDTTVTEPTPISLEPAERPRWRPRSAP